MALHRVRNAPQRLRRAQLGGARALPQRAAWSLPPRSRAALPLTAAAPDSRAGESRRPPAVINHPAQDAEGGLPTPPLDGFGALSLRAGDASPPHYRPRYSPLSSADTWWQDNARKNPNAVGTFLRRGLV